MAFRYKPWLIWGLAAAFFFAEYFARIAPGVMADELMRDFKINALALGTLSACFYVAYLAMQLPVGMLVDRFGSKRLLVISAGFCAIGSLLFGYAPNIWFAQVGRFATGFGAAFAFVGALKLAAYWFPPTRLGLLTGLTQALGMLGAVVGDAPMAFSVSSLGWRHTMLWVTGVFVGLMILMAKYLQDTPEGSIHHLDSIRGKQLWQEVLTVFSRPQNWLNAMYAGLIYAPTAVIAEFWGVSYVSSTYGLSREVAASAVGMIFIGWAIGGGLTGLFSDWLGRRRIIMTYSAFCGAVLMFIILCANHLGEGSLHVLFALYGLTNTGVAMSYAVSTELNPRPIAATALGLTNMSSVILGAALQPVVGLLLDLHWSGHMANGARFYTAGDYRMALSLLPLTSLLAFIVSFFIRETHCKNVGEEEGSTTL